jgi:hypothetical protein
MVRVRWSWGMWFWKKPEEQENIIGPACPSFSIWTP